MSRLLIVRHGQASATAEDYDQLSERGYRQAGLLGEQWAAEGLVPDSVYVGPRKRHRQTFEALANGAATWPEPVSLDEWDEHEAYSVVFASIPGLAAQDEWVAQRADTLQAGGNDAQRAYFDLYKHITLKWVREELDLDGHDFEPWSSFRRRIDAAIDRILEREGRGQTVVVVTSSGPSGVAAGRALRLDDERTLELSWIVHNIAVTELWFNDDRLSLKCFNSLPRMNDRELATLV